MPPHVPAKSFLNDLFRTLEKMVHRTMRHNPDQYKSLNSINANLGRIKEEFTKSPILDEVHHNINDYKKEIQEILNSRPELGDPADVWKLMDSE